MKQRCDLNVHLTAAQVTQPTFFLQRKIGGPASRVINPLSIARAQKALDEAVPPFDGEVRRLLSELQEAVKANAPRVHTIIWENAQEIKGLADTVAKVRLGEAAEMLCRYLQGSPPDFRPDDAIISTIAIVAQLAMKDGADEDPMVAKLLSDSVRAVDAQRHREGRAMAR